MPVKNPKVSVIIPVFRPEGDVFGRLKDALKKQTISVEIIEKWNNPEAVSINLGIKEANGEFIVILAQDCVPENEKFIERIIKPLENKEVVAVLSDLFLPEYQWKKRPFLVRMFTMGDLKVRKPEGNLTTCAYRKKDLERIGYIDENTSAIDVDFSIKIRKIGKVERGNVIVYHMHPHYNYKKMLKTFHAYSRFNGITARTYGSDFHPIGFVKRIIRATPFLGFCSIYFRYPLEKYYHLLPVNFLFGAIPEHMINVLGFWQGFFLGDEEGGSRNKDVLKENKRNTEALEEQKKQK
ncbi:glycosyltransferase [Candidatus Pacearchaeota archaeon]|nr:glycosyltransferase [Candidatus Pacearchaeota archaeon]